MPSVSATALVLSLVGASFASPAGNGRWPRAMHATYTTTAHAAAPTPPGSVENCGAYHLVAEGETCISIGMFSGLTVEEFQELNPAINDACTNLVPGYEYCIGKVTQLSRRTAAPKTPSPTAVPTPTKAQDPTPAATYVPAPGPTKEGATECCREWHTIQEGDTCISIDRAAGITFNQFRAWNPGVNAKCTNLWIGYSYCVDADANCNTDPGHGTTVTTTTPTAPPVATPSPFQVGMVSGCSEFYQAQPGDYCQAVAWRFGIDVSAFILWNPGVGPACSGMLTGYYYCVGM